jgi:RNA polymerase sigma factor FliA
MTKPSFGTLPSVRGVPANAPDRAATVEALVEEHLPLASYAVAAVANRVQLPAHVSRDDLLSGARLALFEAAKRYDPAKGASFATYARTRLQGAVLDELRATDWASRTVRAEARKLEAATDALTAELGSAPTREQVASHLGVQVGAVDALRVDVHRAVVSSMDDDSGRGASLSGPTTPESVLLGRERVGYLLDAIESLPDRLGEVIERSFFDEESLTDIAEDMGVTLSRVSQMRTQGLRLLHAAISTILDGSPVVEVGGSRARSQQRSYLEQVAAASPDYRTRLRSSARPR